MFQHHAMFIGGRLVQGDLPRSITAYISRVPNQLKPITPNRLQIAHCDVIMYRLCCFFIVTLSKMLNKQSSLAFIWDAITLVWHHCNDILKSCAWFHQQQWHTHDHTQTQPWTYIFHYSEVIMSAMASQITGVSIVHSAVFFRRRSKKTYKLRVTGLLAGEFPQKESVTRKMVQFDDVIMKYVNKSFDLFLVNDKSLLLEE